MAHIKKQKITYNDDGSIRSGSASIVETTYNPNCKGRCSHSVRERLGKVIWLDSSGRSGIFLSSTRGLVFYDVDSDTFDEVDKADSRIKDSSLFVEPSVHTVFGDVYLLLMFLKNTGMLNVLKKSLKKDKEYKRLLVHVLHTILRNSSKISCDDFVEKSFLEYFIDDIPVYSLKSDTEYFSKMGDDKIRVEFFKQFVKQMRKINPKFGKGCYVDSTPLPNDIQDNPFNALCSHGVESTYIQTRLILVLDQVTGLPVWYQIIPGNVLDLSTIKSVMTDVVETLDIKITDLVLDAGYVNKDLIETFNLDTKPYTDENGDLVDNTLIARMPAKKGYPHKQLYQDTKKLYLQAKYEIIREGHTYFGYRKEVTIFDCREYAYVYIDKDNALEGNRNYRKDHFEEYQKLTNEEKNWLSIKYGYFVLVSNKDLTPQQMLEEYYGRTNIETIFKTSKEYLNLLPQSKWNTKTVLGKILNDIISTIIYLQLQKHLPQLNVSIPKLIGKTQSLMCMKKQDGTIMVETPNKSVRLFYEDMGVKVPSSIDIQNFKNNILLLEN